MNAAFQRVASGGLLAALIAASVGCYPAYPPRNQAAYSDSKGGMMPQGPDYGGAPPPQRYGVDPALAVAGIAAAGLLGYAIGHNHDHYRGPYYGPVYYGPYRPGYYGPRYYR